MYCFGKSSPTTPISRTGPKKLAATAAWLAEPPSRRGFSEDGVLMESSAVEPTINTLIVEKSGRGAYALGETLTSATDIRRIKNRGDHADALRARVKHIVDVFQRDAANRKPGDRNVLCCPSHVLERHWLRRRFSPGRVDRSDGDIGRLRRHRAQRLLRRVRT